MIKRDGRFEPVSHQAAARQVEHLAKALLGLGLSPGEKVAILAETRLEWLIADLAIQACGAVVVPIYPALPSARVAAMLAHAECAGLILADRSQLDGLLPLREAVPRLSWLVLMEEEPEPPTGIHGLADLLRWGQDLDNQGMLSQRLAALERTDLATLVYTSGTTGLPRAAMLTHGNLMANLEGFAHHLPLGPGDLALAHLPLSHMFERMVGHYCMIHLGATIAYAKSVSTVPEDLRLARPTVLVSVPRFYEKMQAGILASIEAAPTSKRTLFRAACRTVSAVLPQLERARRPHGWSGLKWRLAERFVFRKVRASLGGWNWPTSSWAWG